MLGENGKVYFIDWEHSGRYFLFYDLFWWMQNEALYNENFSHLERYIMGKYDIHFKEIFDTLIYNFNEQLRKNYVYIFILELLNKRILNNSENVKKTANALFSKLLAQIHLEMRQLKMKERIHLRFLNICIDKRAHLTLLFGVAIFLSTIVGLIYTPFMLRQLGQSEYGLYMLIGYLVGCIPILDFSLHNTVYRFVAKYQAKKMKKDRKTF